MDLRKIIKEEIDDFDWIDDDEPEIKKGMRFRCPTLNPDGSLCSWIWVKSVGQGFVGNAIKEGVIVTYRMESGMGELQIRSSTVSKERFLKILKRLECTPIDDFSFKTLK